MKRIMFVSTTILSLAIPPLQAQVYSSAFGGGGQTSQPGETGRYTLNHAEVGAYGDYFSIAPANTTAHNYVGVGGRLGFSIHPNVGIEGEMNYDFAPLHN